MKSLPDDPIIRCGYLFLYLLLLTGCGALYIPKHTAEELKFQVPILVWRDEYIIDKADLRTSGVFCTYPTIYGEKLCKVWIGDAHYEFRSGEWVNAALVKTKETAPRLIPYDPSNDECKTIFKGKSCSPNFEIKAFNLPIPPQALWGFKRVGYRRLWRRGIKGEGVEIAVIDSGVNRHKDLINNVDFSLGFNAINGGNDVSDSGTQHGTHCTGTIVSSGRTTRTLGGCPGCRVIPIKFLTENGSGRLSDAIRAIEYASALKIPIASNSWGGGGYSEPLNQAIKRYCDTGGLFIAAAGNEANNNDRYPRYPASYKQNCIISVASISESGRLSNFSNFGKTTTIAAPGEEINSTIGTTGEAAWNGTSMATPHVSALAGLLKGKYQTATKIKAQIQRRAARNKELKGRVSYSREVRAIRE